MFDRQDGYSETKHALERFMGRGTATSKLNSYGFMPLPFR